MQSENVEGQLQVQYWPLERLVPLRETPAPIALRKSRRSPAASGPLAPANPILARTAVTSLPVMAVALHGCSGMYSSLKGHEDRSPSGSWRARTCCSTRATPVVSRQLRRRGRREVCTIKVGRALDRAGEAQLDTLGALAYLGGRRDIARDRDRARGLVAWRQHDARGDQRARPRRSRRFAIAPGAPPSSVRPSLSTRAAARRSTPAIAGSPPCRRASSSASSTTGRRRSLASTSARRSAAGAASRSRSPVFPGSPSRLRRARQRRSRIAPTCLTASIPAQGVHVGANPDDARQGERQAARAFSTSSCAGAPSRLQLPKAAIMDLELAGRWSSSPAPARASASHAPKRSCAKARRSRSSRAARRTSTPRWRACRGRAQADRDRRRSRARRGRGADGRRTSRRARSDRRAREFGRRGEALPPDELDARRVARRDGREVLQLHPSDRRRRQADGRARRGAIVNIIGSGGKTANPVHLPGGSANAALMLATVGPRRRVGTEGRARQRHQSRRHADGPRAGGPCAPNRG